MLWPDSLFHHGPFLIFTQEEIGLFLAKKQFPFRFLSVKIIPYSPFTLADVKSSVQTFRVICMKRKLGSTS